MLVFSWSKVLYDTAYVFLQNTIYLFLRLTCVAPGASAFFTSSVTSVVKKKRKLVKSHPTALTVTSAVLISHKAAEEAWHTMCHNVQTHTAIHPPVFLDNSHFPCFCTCLLCICPVSVPVFTQSNVGFNHCNFWFMSQSLRGINIRESRQSST